MRKQCHQNGLEAKRASQLQRALVCDRHPEALGEQLRRFVQSPSSLEDLLVHDKAR